jgi:hypothetical protein
MQSLREQLIDALEELEMHELEALLEGRDDDLYWWLSDLHPDEDLDDDIRGLLQWLCSRYSDRRRMSTRVADFVDSDCILKSHVLAALGIPEIG